MSERLEALKSGKNYEFAYNANPRCPHCGAFLSREKTEELGLFHGGTHEAMCGSCERGFIVETFVETTVKYSFSTDDQYEN